MLVIGLTGSAAMGKSTMAAMFAARGFPVFDADRTVHALYRAEATRLVEAAFPGTTSGGAVDRDRLRERVIGDTEAIRRLEALIHPLVLAREEAFCAAAAHAGRRAVVLDIPLLFEVGGEARTDLVIVASAPEAIQRERLRSRPGMSEARMNAMLARQMPDSEKRRRAHFVIDTGGRLVDTENQVDDILRAVAGMIGAK